MDRRLVFRPYTRGDEVMRDPGWYPRRAEWTWCVPALFEGGGRSGDYGQGDRGGPGLARKAHGGARVYPYRKPTLVGGCKCTKVGERTFVKELGKLTP
jgi:hypothetical protein